MLSKKVIIDSRQIFIQFETSFGQNLPFIKKIQIKFVIIGVISNPKYAF